MSKRSAQQAFGNSAGQLSAAAALKQARQHAHQSATSHIQQNGAGLSSAASGASLNGYHEDGGELMIPSDAIEPTTATTPSRPSVKLSNFKNGKRNVLKDSDGVLEISLQSDEYVTCIGEFELEVLKGVVSIHGAMLHANSGKQHVHAFSTQAIPPIVARKDGSTIRLKDHHKAILGSFKVVSPLFRNIGFDATGAWGPLEVSSDDPLQRPLVPLEIDDDAKRVLSRINAKLDDGERLLRIVAVGGKSTGKSTFNRLLCNIIVTRPGKQRCYYLDLDPGQPEFAPPGLISLVEVTTPILGPGYSHPASTDSVRCRLIRSHAIAATSFKDDPGHYIDCVTDLARRIPVSVPVVINACGWITGLGAKVLVDIATLANVTDIVALGPLDEDLEAGLKARASVHKVPRRQGRASPRTPAELRAMQTLVYFHQKSVSLTGGHKLSITPVSRFRPWIVGYSGANAGIEAVLSYGQAPRPEFLGEVLDGSVVAIVSYDAGHLDSVAVERTPNHDLPYIISQDDGFSFPIDPQHSHCEGLAVIRSIDVEAKELHLVTPIPQSRILDLMERKIVLVRGSFDSPDWAYLEDLYCNEEGNNPWVMNSCDRPWVTLREPVGVEGSVWRLRHPPMKDAVR